MDEKTIGAYIEIGLAHLDRLQQVHCHEAQHHDQPLLSCPECQAAHQVRTALEQAQAAAVPPTPLRGGAHGPARDERDGGV